ncbi:MAG: 1-acyl-sn-glycerol-3-phosphate acyltransferase [Acidimicrobiia bacterium]|nr:1-acyl-sn-glycerol-3-phosphate acyltransferase [Acidimicrobiia bacterium]
MRWIVALVARFAAALLLGRMEVAGRDRLPMGRPVLLVANHFNGFVDPLVLTAALGRLPRFVAKDDLRRIPVVGVVLRLVGVVFVRRRRDDTGAASGLTVGAANDGAFVECHRALVDGDTVAIFPEGTTHDRPRIDPLRTGAARIALGARAAGLTVVPVGLTFTDKIALRSSALVLVGEPIAVDGAIERGAGPDDAASVRALTDAIDAGLRAVSLDFPDVETALALEQAAHIALSDDDLPEPSLDARYRLARQLGRAAEPAQRVVRNELGRYASLLNGLHLTDADVIHPTSPSRLLRSALGTAVLVAVLGSLVAATVLVNIWPTLLVAAASLTVTTPVTKGTVRVLVGLVSFPTAWFTAGALTADGLSRISLVALTAAVGALAAIWLVERAMALTHLLLRWRAQRERISTVDLALEVRANVVAAARSAVRTVEA